MNGLELAWSNFFKEIFARPLTAFGSGGNIFSGRTSVRRAEKRAP
jgi:hypothetical protein